MRHEWEGAIKCKNPVRGRWGGPPSGTKSHGIKAATDLAFVARGKTILANIVEQDVPEIGLVAAKPATVTPADSVAKGESKSGSKGKGCSTSGGSTLPGRLLVFAALLLIARRRTAFPEQLK